MEVYDTAAAGVAARIPLPAPAAGSADVAPDGRRVAVGLTGGDVVVHDLVTGRRLLALHGHTGAVTGVRFSADGTRLVSAGADTSAVVWDVSGLELPALPAPPDDLPAAWDALASGDAERAWEAFWGLRAAGTPAVALLAERLKPVPDPDPQRVRALIAELAAQRFGARERASRELAKLGVLAAPQLRQAARQSTPAEAAARAQALLRALDDPGARSPAELQALRGVYLLEWIGGPGALRTLRAVAGGAAGPPRTRAATEALRRLGAAGV